MCQAVTTGSVLQNHTVSTKRQSLPDPLGAALARRTAGRLARQGNGPPTRWRAAGGRARGVRHWHARRNRPESSTSRACQPSARAKRAARRPATQISGAIAELVLERVPHARVRRLRAARAKLSARRLCVVAWPACDGPSGEGAGFGGGGLGVAAASGCVSEPPPRLMCESPVPVRATRDGK